MSEKGPIYGVELIDVLPLGSGSMKQAMPSRMDLNRALKVNQRTVAGYEVLLASWRDLLTACKDVVHTMRALTQGQDSNHQALANVLANTPVGDAISRMVGAIAKAEATP